MKPSSREPAAVALLELVFLAAIVASPLLRAPWSALALSIFAAGWLAMIQLLSSDVGNLDGRLDGWMRLLQLLSLVGIAGTIATLWNLYQSARQPRRPILSIVWLVLVALAAVYLAWLMLTLRTLTPSLNY